MRLSKKKGNREVVIILGPPGSGKGTQGELLAERLHLYYLETSKILETEFIKAKKNQSVKVKGKSYKISDEKKLWKDGILCSPPFVSYLIKKKITELFKEGKNLLLSGSPRTLYEAEEVTPLLKRLYSLKNIKVVLLDISAKESIFRNSHRRICQLMRHPILYSKETAKLKKCPLDGSKLIKRKGLDDPATIKVRLREYKERTWPLVNYFKKEGLSVKKVNGSPPPAIVFRNIIRSLR